MMTFQLASKWQSTQESRKVVASARLPDFPPQERVGPAQAECLFK